MLGRRGTRRRNIHQTRPYKKCLKVYRVLGLFFGQFLGPYEREHQESNLAENCFNQITGLMHAGESSSASEENYYYYYFFYQEQTACTPKFRYCQGATYLWVALDSKVTDRTCFPNVLYIYREGLACKYTILISSLFFLNQGFSRSLLINLDILLVYPSFSRRL